MGDSAPQTNARSLRESLVGLDNQAQYAAAYNWAVANGRVIDMFGTFAKERHLKVFQSGNEFDNWIDTALGVVYKMNNLTHVGGNLNRLLERIDWYNDLFPETALRLIGLQVMSSQNVYPVFAQPFLPNVRFATNSEIEEYMRAMRFEVMQEDGYYENDMYILSDIKPKNVLRAEDGTMFVVDAEIQKK